MEVPHADLPKVTRMVLIHVRPVVMLSTSQTTTAGMLAVLAYSSMAGRDVSATRSKLSSASSSSHAMIRLDSRKGLLPPSFLAAVNVLENFLVRSATDAFLPPRRQSNRPLFRPLPITRKILMGEGRHILLASLAQMCRHREVEMCMPTSKSLPSLAKTRMWNLEGAAPFSR